MRRFEALSPDEEVLGAVIASYKNAINNENFAGIYAKHGLDTVEPDQWYPYQALMDVFNDIVLQNTGAMFDFVSIGMKIGESVKFPPNIASLEDVLRAISAITHLNLRGSDIGYNRVEFLSAKHARIVSRNAMPDDMLYGLYYSYSRRFLPKGTSFTISYDDLTPRRDIGGEETILHIRWT